MRPLALPALFVVVFAASLSIFTRDADQARADRTIASILRESESDFHARARELHRSAKEWLFNNIDKEGLFYYAYNPETGKNSQKDDGVNDVRELLASRVLAAECAQTMRDDICAEHRKNLQYLFANWYKEGPYGAYIEYNGKSKLGATADFLRVLLASPDYGKYRREARLLLQNILYLRNADGSFRAWYKAPSYTYYEDHLLTFYAGQALIALIEYYEREKDESVLDAVRKSQHFYIDHYVKNIRENYYPSYVPWQTQALSRLYAIDPRPEYAEAAFIMNDKLLEMQDRKAHVGRFFDPATPHYGDPHSSSDGVDTEGLTYALELAMRIGDRVREARYREAIRLSIYNLEKLQYKAEGAERYLGDPRRFVGAFRTEEGKGWIRIDTTTHAVDALERIIALW